jgi:hypothetical protein
VPELEGKDRYGKTQRKKLSALNAVPAPRKTGQGSHAVRLIDTPKYQEIVKRVYDYLIDGMRSNEIYAMLCVEDPHMTEPKFVDILQHAYQYAELALHKDREYVFQLHMERYEKLYSDCLQMVNMWGQPLDPIKDWHIMTVKYATAISALTNKEKLLGLHDKSVTIELNEKEIEIKQPEETRGNQLPGIDMTRLTTDEKVELLHLLQESRITPLEGVQKVIVKQTKIEINTETGDRSVIQRIGERNIEDIMYEELPDNVVDKMKLEPRPEEEASLDTSPAVADEVGEKRGVELKDIHEKIKTNLLSDFKNALKKVKGIK